MAPSRYQGSRYQGQVSGANRAKIEPPAGCVNESHNDHAGELPYELVCAMPSPKSFLRLARLPLSAAIVLGGLTLAASDAQAGRPNIKRKGGQWGIMLGGSTCIPGKAKCARDNLEDGGITIDGKTRPSFGLGAELGYRLNKWAFVGASYNLGFFDTSYEVNNTDYYKRGYQNSIYGVFRPIVAAWRFDFGLGMGPGFSRQVFVTEDGNKDYSQGFSWKFAPTIDLFVSRRVFVGAKMDFLLNAHNKTCRQEGGTSVCNATQDRDIAPVHQMLFGIHLGGTFL